MNVKGNTDKNPSRSLHAMVYTGTLVLFPRRIHPDETVWFLARAGTFLGFAGACAGRFYFPAGELGCRWRSEDSRDAGRDGGALRLVSKRESLGLASHAS